MLDITLLKVIKDKTEYEKLVAAVPVAAMDDKTQMLIQDFGKYFKKFPSHKRVDLQLFVPRFRQWHPELKNEQFAAYMQVFKQIRGEVDDETKHGLLGELYEVDLATKIANLCNLHGQGDLQSSLSEGIESFLDSYKINMGAKAVHWDDTDIDVLLQEDIDESGIRWRLECLNASMRPLRPGDFGIVAGRPDKGKTTFFASESTNMARQLPDDKNILWLNNEGMSGRIVKRIYQSALGLPVSELVKHSQNGSLTGMYEEVVGRRDRVRVVNIHGFNVGQVEGIIENSNAGVIIYDMIDNIKGFGFESRNDLALEAMYQWARERCVKYSCIGLAGSQISNDGDGKMFPDLGMLKDSKTGKQGACDFQLMIGAVNNPVIKSRWLSLPKNKLPREGAPSDPRAEVHFDPTRARFEDLGGHDSYVPEPEAEDKVQPQETTVGEESTYATEPR